jgi:uncharacterized protein (TIRG00374 family)
VGLLGWLLTKVEWSTIGSQFGRLHYGWILPALLLPAASLSLMSLRWSKVLHLLGTPMSLKNALRLTLVGQFFNSFLPGATGGDIYKISSVICLYPEQKGLAASSVIIDRIFATLALLMVGCFSFLAFSRLWLGLLEKQSLSPSVLVIVCLGGVLVLFLAFLALLKLGRLPKKITESLGTYISSLRAARIHGINTLVPLSGISLAIHLCNFTGAYFLARALSIEVTYLQMLCLMPVILLAILLPISINGHGIREVVIIGFFTVLGIHGQPGASARDISIAFSMLYVAADFCWCLPGAGIFLLGREARSAIA